MFFLFSVNRLDILHAVEVWQRNFKRIVSNCEMYIMLSGINMALVMCIKGIVYPKMKVCLIVTYPQGM